MKPATALVRPWDMAPYRDDVDALAARHTALEVEVAAKTRERDDAARLLAEAKARARLPVLDNIRVASPCTADWAAMTGDDRVRHCGACDKDVFNLSSMTRDEAQALIVERAGRLCVRYYQRKDGTILLADCTIGVHRRRKRRLFAAGAAVLLATGGGAAAAITHHGAPDGDPPYATMGAVPPPVVAPPAADEWQATAGAPLFAPADDAPSLPADVGDDEGSHVLGGISSDLDPLGPPPRSRSRPRQAR